MLWLQKLRGWLRQPYLPDGPEKIDWLGVITIFFALSMLVCGLWIVLQELGYACWLRYTLAEKWQKLFWAYPQKIFLLSPLAVFYILWRRQKCRTNADCLKCYVCMLLLFGLSALGIYWEAMACNENWSFMWSC